VVAASMDMGSLIEAFVHHSTETFVASVTVVVGIVVDMQADSMGCLQDYLDYYNEKFL
jgi:hypothetical protein